LRSLNPYEKTIKKLFALIDRLWYKNYWRHFALVKPGSVNQM